MKINPVSEEQAAGVLPKGEYDALVVNAVEKTSKSGNPMIELDITVYGEREQTVRDWLLSVDTGAWKLQSFCKSAGLWDTYQAGDISDASCKDRNVRVKVDIQPSDGKYPPRNKIVDYLPRELVKPAAKPASDLKGVPAAQTRAAQKSASGDDIPF